MKTFSTHFMTIEPVCIVWNMILQHHIDKVIFTLCLPFLKCGYNPFKQGYTPYGPYLVIIPVTLPNFNWQGGANLWEQRVAKQQESSSKFTKYCACHAKRHDWSASHMKSHLQYAKQHESSSNFTKYCACHATWISWWTVLTYGRSFTMRGATQVILQLHQILRLARNMHLIIDLQHIWDVIYNARSN